MFSLPLFDEASTFCCTFLLVCRAVESVCSANNSSIFIFFTDGRQAFVGEKADAEVVGDAKHARQLRLRRRGQCREKVIPKPWFRVEKLRVSRYPLTFVVRSSLKQNGAELFVCVAHGFIVNLFNIRSPYCATQKLSRTPWLSALQFSL